MCDIFIIRAYFLKMIYSICEFIDNINFSDIKLKIASFIARIIKMYNEFYTLNEIYSFNINNNIIHKYNYSTLYFNILYTCYNFPILYPFYYLFFMINPIISNVYVLNVKHNNYNYKLIVDNRNNYNIDMIFKYRDYILTNELFDMKEINLICSNDPLNNDNKKININQYIFNNMYQTLNYILLDINSEFNTINYLLPIKVEITDLIDDTEKITLDVKNELIESNISTICEQLILSNNFSS